MQQYLERFLEMIAMTDGVQLAFKKFYEGYRKLYPVSPEQNSAASAIML